MAGVALGISPQRIRDLIVAGRLPARRVGHSYIIEDSNLDLVRVRVHGRPPRPKPEVNQKRGKNK